MVLFIGVTTFRVQYLRLDLGLLSSRILTVISIWIHTSKASWAETWNSLLCVCACVFRGWEVKSWIRSHENLPLKFLCSGSCGFDLRLLTSPHQQNAYLCACVCVYSPFCLYLTVRSHPMCQVAQKETPQESRSGPERGQVKVKLPAFINIFQLSLRPINCLPTTDWLTRNLKLAIFL